MRKKKLKRTPTVGEIKYIKKDDLFVSKFNARKSRLELEELVESIKRDDVLDPLHVRWNQIKGKYEIVDGQRRFKAGKKAGLSIFPVIVHDWDDIECLLKSVVLNRFTLQWDPIDEAGHYNSTIYEMRKKDPNLTDEGAIQQISERTSKGRSKIRDSILLLKLDESEKKDVRDGVLPISIFPRLVPIEPKERRNGVREIIKKEGMNKDESLRFIRYVKSNPKKSLDELEKSFPKIVTVFFFLAKEKVKKFKAIAKRKKMLPSDLFSQIVSRFVEGESVCLIDTKK